MISTMIMERTSCFTYSRDGLAGVLGFTNCNTNQLSSKIGEDGGNHGTPQSKEATGASSALVLFETVIQC